MGSTDAVHTNGQMELAELQREKLEITAKIQEWERRMQQGLLPTAKVSFRHELIEGEPFFRFLSQRSWSRDRPLFTVEVGLIGVDLVSRGKRMKSVHGVRVHLLVASLDQKGFLQLLCDEFRREFRL